MPIEQPGDFFQPRPAPSLQHLQMTTPGTTLKKSAIVALMASDLFFTQRARQVRSRGRNESCRFPHLLDEFAAQRDISPAEDVSHVSWDTQVIFFIRLWHLYTKYDNTLNNIQHLDKKTFCMVFCDMMKMPFGAK